MEKTLEIHLQEQLNKVLDKIEKRIQDPKCNCTDGELLDEVLDMIAEMRK